MSHDLAIARASRMRPIAEVAERAGIPPDALDFHAITSAHNLLAALVDNHVYWGNALAIDTRRIVWRRVLDMNDRALRAVTVGLGGASGAGTNGFARESGFDITVASEVMACLC